jgi:hypothetical protein
MSTRYSYSDKDFMFKYSNKEKEMVKVLYPYMLPIVEQFAPGNLFRILAEHCFLNKIKGPAAESLRRLILEINKVDNVIYRNTPEWDNLITL